MKLVDISKLYSTDINHVLGLLEQEIDSVESELEGFKKRYKKDKISEDKYTAAKSYYKPMLKAYKKMFKFLNELDNNTEVVE